MYINIFAYEIFVTGVDDELMGSSWKLYEAMLANPSSYGQYPFTFSCTYVLAV